MYVITGIGGNTGSAAAAALLAQGHSVRALVRNASRAAAWHERGVQLIEGDVTDADSLARAFDGADGAYAMIPADPHDPDPVAFYRVAAEAIRRATATAGLARLVLLSSEAAHLTGGTGPILGAHHAEAILSGVAHRPSSSAPASSRRTGGRCSGSPASRGSCPL